MPELPDVKTFKGYFDATSLHETIDSVQVRDSDILEETSPQGLGRRLKGKRFDSTTSHGKYLFALLDGGGGLVLHFGMTGFLEAFSGGTAEPE
ncbi:MAG: DNA-formamidopyrimidine glycosylase family protein, partial [Desulfohalobiaceae bacterium]